jgi:hypothetical protein
MLRNITLVVALAAVLACCNGGDVGPDGGVVGGSCRDGRDCAERCVKGGSFPGGTCTVDCRDDRDCPDGTWCIDTEGGVCLLGCGYDEDCRGDGYECKDRDREGAGGKEAVCIH